MAEPLPKTTAAGTLALGLVAALAAPAWVAYRWPSLAWLFALETGSSPETLAPPGLFVRLRLMLTETESAFTFAFAMFALGLALPMFFRVRDRPPSGLRTVATAGVGLVALEAAAALLALALVRFA